MIYILTYERKCAMISPDAERDGRAGKSPVVTLIPESVQLAVYRIKTLIAQGSSICEKFTESSMANPSGSITEISGVLNEMTEVIDGWLKTYPLEPKTRRQIHVEHIATRSDNYNSPEYSGTN